MILKIKVSGSEGTKYRLIKRYHENAGVTIEISNIYKNKKNSTLKIKIAYSPETSAFTYHTTRSHIFIDICNNLTLLFFFY
jgi:hypothetical protein